MRSALLRFAAFVVLTAGAVAGLTPARGADWPRLPAIEGEFAGKFTSPMLAGAPVLAWKLSIRPTGEGRRRAELAVEAEGTSLHAHADVDAATGDGVWLIDRAELAVAAWWPLVAGKVGGDFAAAAASGQISIAGGGTLRGGVPSGAAVLTLADGHVSLDKPKLEFTGLTARIELPALPSLVAQGIVQLAEVRVAGLTLRAGKIAFAFEEPGTVRVTEAGLLGLGGTLAISPFAVELAKPVVAVTLKLDGILLEELVALLPQALSEARGRAEGQMALGWSVAGGLSFGDGRLGLVAGTPASVRLAPTPGLITGQLPASNPARASLSRVELGQTPLNVHLLSAEFHPAGDASGRTATLRLEAEPVDRQLIAPMVIDVNVAGPLDQLVKLGLNDHVKIGGAR